MVGAIGYQVTNEYEARLYQVGTYDAIDWSHPDLCNLGGKFTSYSFKQARHEKAALILAVGVDGKPILRLVETKRYVLRLVCREGSKPSLPKFQNENNKFLRLEKDDDVVIFQFINYLGYSKITFEPNDVGLQLNFEVIPDKINYEDDYIALTESLAEVCSELLLECSGATSNKFSQSEEDAKNVLEQFIFLRKFCYSQNLYSIFEAIKRNPDRVLSSDEELKSVGMGMPARKFFTKPFSYSRGWQKIARSNGSSYYIPGFVAVARKYDGLDTPANRFVKYAFMKFDDVCLQLVQSMEAGGKCKQAECYSEALAIHNILQDIFNEPFFDDIGNLDIMPQNSQVLQKREGYSQILSAYSMLDLALQLNWSGKDDVFDGESKNVALLYEYWIYFELYKIIAAIDGCQSVSVDDNNFLVFKDSGLTISLREGKMSCQAFIIKSMHIKVNLYYNRSFSKNEFRATSYEGSYSRPFRPDYTLAIFPDIYDGGRNNGEDEAIRNGAVSYIHFDAKYRVSDLIALVGKKSEDYTEDELDDDKADEVINTYKRGDLLKMHTYNDAIRRTVGSFILYPGRNDNAENGNTGFRLYDEILPGVGAFAIRPGMDKKCENVLRDFIVKALTSKCACQLRLNRMNHYAEMVLREPAVREGDSVAAHNFYSDSIAHKCVMGYIRADKDTDYYYALARNGLLEIGKSFYFYFYAIKGNNVYSHHPELFSIKSFCFYTNDLAEAGSYIPEQLMCRIECNNLVSKAELVSLLSKQGYETSEDNHFADFYYMLQVRVVENYCCIKEISIKDVNRQNGNDAYSPHSPKILSLPS